MLGEDARASGLPPVSKSGGRLAWLVLVVAAAGSGLAFRSEVAGGAEAFRGSRIADGSAAAVGSAAGVGPAAAVYYADGAPPGHSGGFGEPTCQRCHFDAEAREGGRLEVAGFPTTWRPGRGYPLVVRLRSPGMAGAGFQLAARFCDGRQAGHWRTDGGGVGVAAPDSSGVRYVGHTRPARPGPGGEAVWRFTWIAPEESGAPVRLHLAANAANGDDSEFGDAVYADSLTSAPADSGGGADGAEVAEATGRGPESCEVEREER